MDELVVGMWWCYYWWNSIYWEEERQKKKIEFRGRDERWCESRGGEKWPASMHGVDSDSDSGSGPMMHSNPEEQWATLFLLSLFQSTEHLFYPHSSRASNWLIIINHLEPSKQIRNLPLNSERMSKEIRGGLFKEPRYVSSRRKEKEGWSQIAILSLSLDGWMERRRRTRRRIKVEGGW